jgi:hypothetical protein
MLDTEKPDGLWTLVRSRVAVENVADGLVEVALASLCGGEEGGTL